jgi:selenocysteine lyase/cysteine desulfurase
MLACKRSKFSLPPNVTYLNCAYMSPLMKDVEKAGLRGLRIKRNPGNVPSTEFFENSDKLRAEFAKLVNASDQKRIAIIPAASYGLANVAKNLNISKSQHIVVAAEQFPSNYYTWQSVCHETGAQMKIVPAPTSLISRGRIWNERVLESIDKNTRAVAIAHAHWADGTKFDLEALRKRTTEVGALLIIDGTQSVGAVPFDIQKIKPDALICAGYKWLLGPYSIGMGYYGEYFDNGKPIEENWINRLNSEDFSALVSYEPQYQPGAIRFDYGERANFIQVPMMLKALEQLNRWGVENVQEYCSSLSEPAIDQLRAKGFWIEDKNFRGPHLFGVRMPKEISTDKLKQEFLKNRVYVSFRGDAIRVSPNVYNTEKDLKKFVRILTKA